MAKKRRDDDHGLDRIMGVLEAAPPGLHDLDPPIGALPPGLPEPLIELYARCDGGRIFLDYLRNGVGATTVSAWSARARPGLGISVPVAWGELPALRGGDQWSVKTVHERLDIGNEAWSEYARAARGLASAMSALGYVPPQK